MFGIAVWNHVTLLHQAKPTNSQRVSEFLIRLPKRGKTAFETLVHALMETGQEHIADDLDKFIADEWWAYVYRGFVPHRGISVRARFIPTRSAVIVRSIVMQRHKVTHQNNQIGYNQTVKPINEIIQITSHFV